jgi:hypothetical protein
MILSAPSDQRRSFDALVAVAEQRLVSFTEDDLLQSTHWALGEDARLREDVRFRQTPWRRWMLATQVVANDAVFARLQTERKSSLELKDALQQVSGDFGRTAIFCTGDPRFVLRGEKLSLAASLLSWEPVVESSVGDLEKYTTHLPLHSLKAAAASEPAGEWGPSAQEEAIETLGWVPVSLSGKRLNDRMFVAAIEGHSMDDGRGGLRNGGYAIFELWPAGTRQNLNVLVRGAFRDPETGTYAVKKYVADARDEQGVHQRISLVSLNPDKERYPDIELRPENDDDITVVAKVVQALSPDEYERRPIVPKAPGRRLLSGPEGLQEQAQRLGRRLASFFDPTNANEADADDSENVATEWRAQLICLPAEQGGLHVQVGPLTGLLPFVKKLRVVGSGFECIVLVANVRSRAIQVGLRPETGPWTWQAVDFEDETELGLERLDVAALPADCATLFLLDSDEVGQLVKGKTLTPGRIWRVLLPPAIGANEFSKPLNPQKQEGWHLWEVTLPLQPPQDLLAAITATGLTTGAAAPALGWAPATACAWRTNAKGQPYPVFTPQIEPTIRIQGLHVDDETEAAIFLHGPTGTERLPVANNAVVSLGNLQPGHWICSLVHIRTSVPASTLIFAVQAKSTPIVSAAWQVIFEHDLDSLQISAPPGWPVRLRWVTIGAQQSVLATLHASADGSVALNDTAPLLNEHARRARVADLIIDFGELGRKVIPFDSRNDIEQVCQELGVLWQNRGEQVQRLAGEWMQLMISWIAPVASLLGYGLDDIPPAKLLELDIDPGYGLAAWRLTLDERLPIGITRSPVRILVLTNDLDAVVHKRRDWLDGVCALEKLRDIIISDGRRWTAWRKGTQKHTKPIWDLNELVVTNSVEKFVSDLGEGL